MAGKAAKKPAAKKKTAKKSGKVVAKPANSRDAAIESSSASKEIDVRIKELADWRGRTLAHVRTLIKEADPDVVEDVKWRKPSNPRGVAVWSHPGGGRVGIICTGEIYKDKVKLTFASGAALDDPAGLFNAGLRGGTRRAVDLREGDVIDERAFKALVRDAVRLNTSTRG